MALNSFSSIILLVVSVLYHALALSLTSTGQTLMLGDIHYYLPATPVSEISTASTRKLQGVDGLVPVTVVTVSAGNDSIGGLESILKKFAADDVWNTGFLEGE